jgi:ribose transport system substrate-binding protein
MSASLDSRYFVESAAKALDVLESFDTMEEDLTITEVARRSAITYCSAFRLLYTLERRGYVIRHHNGKKYRRTPARKRYRIGYAGLDRRMKFSDEVTRSIVLAARKYDVVLTVKDNEFNPAKTLVNVDSLLEEDKINLLIEYQSDEMVAHMIAAKCHDAGVPVIAVNFAHPGAYYFGGNNHVAGEMSGQHLVEVAKDKWLGRADKLLIVTAKGMGSTQDVRVKGICDRVLRGLSGLKPSDIIMASPGITAQDGYLQTKKELMRLERTAKVLIGALTDPLAIGSCRAALKLGSADNTLIVGQGAGADGRRYLKRGPLSGSVSYFPHTYGERIVPLALKILEGEKVPLIFYTEHVLLTKDNLDQYYPS